MGRVWIKDHGGSQAKNEFKQKEAKNPLRLDGDHQTSSSHNLLEFNFCTEMFIRELFWIVQTGNLMWPSNRGVQIQINTRHSNAALWAITSQDDFRISLQIPGTTTSVRKVGFMKFMWVTTTTLANQSLLHQSSSSFTISYISRFWLEKTVIQSG